jgi:4-amino-4-deoxy-L-arabinose transferase-like glycosyltransferase
MQWKQRIIDIFFKKDLILAPILLLLFLIKIPDFSLPYFWDEAWSYIPAIKEFVIRGPSLMPDSISPELYRGHPLLFYFLSSTWMKVFGDEIWTTRLFPFLISVILIISIYRFVKNTFNKETAVLTTTIFFMQSVFLAQSTFLLPEVLLTLFTVLTFHSYLHGNKMITALWLTLALFTKESGIIIWISIAFFTLLKTIKNIKSISWLDVVKSFSYLLIPISFIAIFFVIQKLRVGWFFFPEHIGYITWKAFFHKLDSRSSYLFIYMGRNLITITGLIALFILIIRKDKELKQKREEIIQILLFSVFYLIFSSINFFTKRYLLPVLPFTITVFIFMIYYAFKKYKLVLICIFLILMINNLWFTIKIRKGNDDTLGYRDMIFVHKQAVDYCEQNSFYDKTIAAHFLTYKNITDKNLGYLTGDKAFEKVSTSIDSTTDLVIISSVDHDKIWYEKIKEYNGTLIKRFERKNCWTEIQKLK